LILRGPQTLAELRANAVGLGGPTEPEALVAVLESLNDRAQPLAVLLPRATGQKEARYAQTLTGSPEAAPFEVIVPPVATGSRTQELEQRVAALEARIAALEQALGVG
jgi:uncharacterized protein YceH (UPF0502 family)